MPKDVRASSPHFTYMLNKHSRGQTTLLFLCSLFRIIALGIIHCFSDFQSSTHFVSHCVTFGIIVNVIYSFFKLYLKLLYSWQSIFLHILSFEFYVSFVPMFSNYKTIRKAITRHGMPNVIMRIAMSSVLSPSIICQYMYQG